jgi:hypothetical protein
MGLRQITLILKLRSEFPTLRKPGAPEYLMQKICESECREIRRSYKLRHVEADETAAEDMSQAESVEILHNLKSKVFETLNVSKKTVSQYGKDHGVLRLV